MTYIDYLNRFNRWLDSNTISSSAQLLYFKMLDVFNRANWPEYVQIDNRRLTLLADVYSEKSAIKARNELVEIGWIVYEQGKKGNPGKYSLSINTVNIHCNKYSEIITVNENSAIDSENDSKSLIYNNINNKTLEKKKTKKKIYCSEPEIDSEPKEPPVILLPLNDGTEYPVTKEQFKELQGLYPAVDIMQQLRNMRGWCLSNPNKRKTNRGINRFINRWLSQEQDSGKNKNGGNNSGLPYL